MSLALSQACHTRSTFCHAGVSSPASQRWHRADRFRRVVSHSAMPSLCPLPSALDVWGWREVSSGKRVSALLGLRCTSVLPKPPSWHLGVPGRPRCRAATHSHPACQRAGGGAGSVHGPCCPTGNDTPPVPSLSRAHSRLTVRGTREVSLAPGRVVGAAVKTFPLLQTGE